MNPRTSTDPLVAWLKAAVVGLAVILILFAVYRALGVR